MFRKAAVILMLLPFLHGTASTPPEEDLVLEPMNSLSAPVDIQDELFGYNAEYMIDQCLDAGEEISLFTPINNVRLSEGCLELVDELDPAVLRFPGGSTANYYHFHGTGYGYDPAETWNTSIGFSELALDDVMPVNFIELFADLAVQSGSKVIFTMNLFTHFKPGGASINNPASEAYQKRVQENMDALGYLISEGVDVVAVELGNELYFEWELTGIFTINTAVDKYISLARDYAHAIKALYPDIEIGVPGALVNSNPEFNYWNSKMQNAEFAHGIVVHEYDRNVTDNCNENLSQENYFPCARDNIDHFVDIDLEEQLKVYLNLFPDKELWLTEWGIGEPFRVANTFVDAYSVFNMFNKFPELVLQYPGRFSYANRHNLITGGYHYPAFGKKLLNESDDLFYQDDKAIRASAYPALLMSGIFNGDHQFAGHVMIDGCRAWVYTGPEGYRIALSNNTGLNKQLQIADIEEILETQDLKFNSISWLSANELFDAAGISHDNQYQTGLTNEFSFREQITPHDDQSLFISGLSINVIEIGTAEVAPPEPEPVPTIYFSINPTVCFGDLTVKIVSDIPAEAELLIVNSVTGAVAVQQDINLQAGFNPYFFNMDYLPGTSFGIYRVVINFSGGTRDRSFFYVG